MDWDAAEWAARTRAEAAASPDRAPSSRNGALTAARRFVFGDGAQWFAILLTIFAIAPLAYPGFFQSHAGLSPVYNLYDLESRPLWSFPVWTTTVGQAFDPYRSGRCLPYMMAAAFHRLGLSAPQAILASYALSFLVAAWAMYRWLRGWLGPGAALLAAAVYTYLPYHLMTVYVRGDLAEAWLLALLPAVFWAASGPTAGRRDCRPWVTLAVTFGLLFLTNLGLALLTWPAVAGYIWLRGGWGRRPGALVTAASVLGVAFVARLAAGNYPAPVAFDSHFPYLSRLFSSAWNAASGAEGWLNAVPLQIGLAPVGLALLSGALLVMGKLPAPDTADCASSHSQRSVEPREVWYWLIVAGVSFALMWSPLNLLWQLTGWHHLVTYPWQMLGLLGLCLAVFAGAAVASDARLRTATVQAGLVTFVVLSSYSYLSPRFFDFDIDFTPGAEVPHVHTMAPRQAPLAIFGDHQIALLDFRLEGPLRHGATVRLNALWQVLRPLDDDLMVFVHALDDEGNIWGQQDVELLSGERPTSQWSHGEIVAKRYEFQIRLDGPRAGYHLEIGLYRPDTGERLLLADGQSSLLIRGD